MERPEHKFVLLGSREQLDETEINVFHNLYRNGLNWKEVLGQVYGHRLPGLFYANLLKLGINSEEMFAEARHSLRTTSAGNAAKNGEQIAIIEELADSLNAADLPFVIVKGPIMAHYVYRDLRARVSNDVDIIVHPGSVRGVVEALEGIGYVQGRFDSRTKSVVPASRSEKMLQLSHTHELFPFVKPWDGKFYTHSVIDVNFSVDFGTRGQDHELIADLLSRRVPVSIGRSVAYSLPWEEFLLHLCLHTAREARGVYWIMEDTDLTLYKFCDIHYTAMRVSIDWDAFLRRVREADAVQDAFWALHHTELLYPRTVPSTVLHELGDGLDLTYLDQFWDGKDDCYTWKTPFLHRVFDFDRAKQFSGNTFKSYAAMNRGLDSFSTKPKDGQR